MTAYRGQHTNESRKSKPSPINNEPWFAGKDVARGLGFTQTQTKGGMEYTSIRWETVNRYLSDLGFPNKLGKEDYIPENIFYRLAMKAKNKTAEKFQALVAEKEAAPIGNRLSKNNKTSEKTQLANKKNT